MMLPFMNDPEARMRRDRDMLLLQYVDIKMRSYLHSGQAIPQDWIDYRQAVLDVPQNNTPELNEDLELININWPTKPKE